MANIFFPKAKVCADSFHVLKHLTDDFRKIRLRLARNTEDHTLKYLLVKFRSIFDHNKNIDNEPRYNKRLNRYVNLRDIRDIVFNAFEELRAAYELKEYYIRLNAEITLEEAPKVIDEAIEYFESCGRI
ncbi:transposase [Phascolarctobacterium succinatutens]|uniref:transposase n=1 Tax=Phascolarctobacterium succinatutens TaxID=626940 RepID=UPI0034C5D1E3